MTPPIEKPTIDQVKDRDQWLAERRKGLGGSDVSALFDCNPWMSPYTLYLDKIDEAPKRADDAILQVGHDLEPLTRRLYEDDTGRVIYSAQERYQHAEFPWMLATIDGTIPPYGDSGPGVFEGKTTNPYGKDEWLEGVPLYYLVQLYHYMIVTGRKWGSIAVLVLGEKDPLLWTDVERDEEFAEQMVAVEQRFWEDHVLARVPPEVDAHPSTTEMIKRLHPDDNGLTVDFGDEGEVWAERLHIAKADAKAADTNKKLWENRIKNAMGGATYARLPNGSGFSWISSERRGYTVNPSTIRTLRVVSQKTLDQGKRVAELALTRI